MRVTNRDRWENTKLVVVLLCLIGVIVSIGGLEGEPDELVQIPVLLIISAVTGFITLAHLRRR